MTISILAGLSAVVVLGFLAQYVAWRIHLPSILLLLVIGFAAGPEGMGLVDPDRLLGEALLPFVSLSVAVILFEGGLSLRLKELRATGNVVWRLVSVGAFVTWALCAVAARVVLGLPLPLSVLFGAILSVTGPTVVQPLLRHIRPTGPAGSVLKWEGIVIDPIGAVLAVLVFEGILAGGLRQATLHAVLVVLKTALVGGVAGAAGAALLYVALRRYWLPDHLHNPATLAILVASYLGANTFVEDSGLLAATLMGFLVANQGRVAVRHIVEFKENLRTLLISTLFVLLAARLTLDDFTHLDWRMWMFLALLVLVVRPLTVAASTFGSDLPLKDRIFVAGVAPRGIVAASVASIFALRLGGEAARLVPLTFLVIVFTVGVYGLAAPPLARVLGLAQANPQGFLFVGAHAWARAIAKALHEAGVPVLLCDRNWEHVAAARREGLRAYRGDALAEYAADEMDLRGIGRLLALTPNDQVNSLACMHFIELFGRGEVYQLPIDESSEEEPALHFRGRFLFGPDASYDGLEARFAAGGRVEAIQVTEGRDLPESLLPLFAIDPDGKVTVSTTGRPIRPDPETLLVGLY